MGKNEITLAIQKPDTTAQNGEKHSALMEIRIPWKPPERAIPFSQPGSGRAEADQKLVQALVRAHCWAAALMNNEFTSIDQLAAAIKLHSKVVRTELKLAFLAPHITGSILNGDFKQGLPELRRISALSWRKQLDQIN